MYLQLLLHSIITIKIIQTENWKCGSDFEPCISDCLLGIAKLSESNSFLFFYTKHYLEFSQNNFSIAKFSKHSAEIEINLRGNDCKLISSSNHILLNCNDGFYQYYHTPEPILRKIVLNKRALKLIKFKDNFKFSYESIDKTIIFTKDKYFICDSKFSLLLDRLCRNEEINFITFYHLKEGRNSFLTSNAFFYFTSYYFMFLKLNEQQIIKNYFSSEINQTTSNQTTFNGTTQNNQTDFNVNEKNKDNKPIQLDLIDKLLKQIEKDKQSVRKYYYKDLFGCSIIDFNLNYRLPLNQNLTPFNETNEDNKPYLVYNLINSMVTCYCFLFLFFTSLFGIIRFLNSNLARILIINKSKISDLDNLFVQLRTEIENGVMRKLSDTKSRETYSRSDIRILIDTLLHEQLFVNSLNLATLDARKSIDLVRHLMNEVTETIKSRRSDKSTEKLNKKYMNLCTLDTVLSATRSSKTPSPSKLPSKSSIKKSSIISNILDTSNVFYAFNDFNASNKRKLSKNRINKK